MGGVVGTRREGLQSEAEVLDWAQGALGPIEVVNDLTTPGSKHRVLRLSMRNSDRVIAKWFDDSSNFFRTHDALNNHATALGSFAPKIIDHHDGLKSLVMTEVPGQPVSGEALRDPIFHFQAGVLLRQFHDSAPPTKSATLAQEWGAQLSNLIDQTEDTLGLAGSVYAREMGMRLLDLEPIQLYPTHGSFGPEHLLMDKKRGLHLVGFSFAEYNPWILDTAGLNQTLWCYSADLRRAFFQGYGREAQKDDLLVARVGELIALLQDHLQLRRSRSTRLLRERNMRMLHALVGETLF